MKVTRLQRIRHLVVALCLAAAGTLLMSTAAAQDVRLRTSHQWPGGQGDIRDEMVQIIAREAKAADVGLEIRVYPGASLYKPREEWNAMARDRLDISAFPLAYAGGQHPEFNLTLMPGLVKNHDHAHQSPIFPSAAVPIAPRHAARAPPHRLPGDWGGITCARTRASGPADRTSLS